MKRVIAVVSAFVLLALITVSAQAQDKGDQIFAHKCAMCHMVNGKGGKVGPELSKVSAKLKEQALKAKLEDPKKSNPKSMMPAFKTLPKADMDALLGYLKTLK